MREAPNLDCGFGCWAYGGAGELASVQRTVKTRNGRNFDVDSADSRNHSVMT